MSKIDLHIHSNISGDGELSPREILSLCKEKGIRLAAVTDHNSVRGVKEALDHAGDVQVITGIEMDCSYQGRNFHLLGYGIDPNRSEFYEVEADILRQEREASEKKIRLFEQAFGIDVDEKAVFSLSENGVVSGEMIAETLLAKEDAAEYEILRPYLPGGAKSDMPHVHFYWDFFAEGKAAYVPIRYLPLPDAAALIHRAGGIAVLAHPGQNLSVGEPLFFSLLSEKIDGIEAFSSYHTEDISRYYLEAALQRHLFVTCGSDFHGKHKPCIALGAHHSLWSDAELMSDIKRWPFLFVQEKQVF